MVTASDDFVRLLTELDASGNDFTERIADLPNEVYHQGPGISHSQSKLLAECPMKYWGEYVSGKAEKKDPTESTLKGTGVHYLTLEGRGAFNEHCVYRPEFAGTGSRAAKAEWDKEHAGLVILKEDWRPDVEGMAAALLSTKMFRGVFDGNEIVENSFFARFDGTHGEMLKCRPDVLNPGLRLVGDVKTCQDASPDGFNRAVRNFSYGTQGAYYDWILSQFGVSDDPLDFVFFAVESQFPYCTATYRVKPEHMERYRDACKRRIETLVRCRESNEWPSYNAGALTELEPSKWDLERVA